MWGGSPGHTSQITAKRRWCQLSSVHAGAEGRFLTEMFVAGCGGDGGVDGDVRREWSVALAFC